MGKPGSSRGLVDFSTFFGRPCPLYPFFLIFLFDIADLRDILRIVGLSVGGLRNQNINDTEYLVP